MTPTRAGPPAPASRSPVASCLDAPMRPALKCQDFVHTRPGTAISDDRGAGLGRRDARVSVFRDMTTLTESRIEPAPEVLEAARRWLEPVRRALGSEFLAAYLTGSVLTSAFDPRRSRVNLLVTTR